MTSQKRTRKPLLFLMIIFILPVIAGSLLYYYHDYFQFKTTNHGKLVSQPIDAKYLYSSTTGGDQKVWRVIHVSASVCDAQCDKINYQLHQVQKALGKNYDRVAIVTMDAQNPLLPTLQNSFAQQENNFIAANKIYLVDPLGNLFMYYPDTTDLMNVLKDLKKVLEVSQIG